MHPDEVPAIGCRTLEKRCICIDTAAYTDKPPMRDELADRAMRQTGGDESVGRGKASAGHEHGRYAIESTDGSSDRMGVIRMHEREHSTTALRHATARRW